MDHYCAKCGTKVDESCHYCTECGTMISNQENFTYENKSINNPLKYLGSGEAVKNDNYRKLVSQMNATLVVGVGVCLIGVALLVWITFLR